MAAAWVDFLERMPASVQYLGLVLLLMSVCSWGLIVYKYLYFSRISRQYQQFEDNFWSGIDLGSYYQEIVETATPIEAIFCSGYGCLLSSKRTTDIQSQVDQAKESMRIQQKKWEIDLYGRLSWLATIAAVGPYVGLLGTVFGVMHTFQGMLSAQDSSLSLLAVAPGISEALAMTALGLFVAIPATVAFNRLSIQLDGLTGRFELFQEEFLLLVRKQHQDR